MERVAVAGLSLHQTDVEGLEHAKRGLTALEAPAAKALADRLGASEAVLISTCNRLELVFARENGHAPTSADRAALAEALGLESSSAEAARFFLHTGRSAARHLFRVTASLDSLVLGEDQILSQVRGAYAEARALGLTGRILSLLFEQAIQLGKRVRTGTDLSRHPVSVVSLGVAHVLERLNGLPDARIAVIGAGATGAHAARALSAAGRPPAFIVNRSPARARELADEVGARVLALDALRAGAEPLDALVSATSAPLAVLDAAALRRLAGRTRGGRRFVAADLALPRDLEPCDDPRLDVIDLETLRARAEENRKKRAAAAAEAELLVEEHVAQLFRERAVDEVTGSFSPIAEEARETFELELARLCEGRLAHLAERDRAAVERWARATFGRLAHVPFRALKRMAREDALPRSEWEGVE
jgi:glutamyl-tRNA reductase